MKKKKLTSNKVESKPSIAAARPSCIGSGCGWTDGLTFGVRVHLTDASQLYVRLMGRFCLLGLIAYTREKKENKKNNT